MWSGLQVSQIVISYLAITNDHSGPLCQVPRNATCDDNLCGDHGTCIDFKESVIGFDYQFHCICAR